MKRLIAIVLLCPAMVMAEEAYRLETIPVPKQTSLEVGGMCFTRDGTLVVSTRLGEIWKMKPPEAGKAPDWHLFATGLNEPLGICAGDGDELYVLQRPELTRVTDTTRSGTADLFETVCDAWPLNGFDTEYSFGLARDTEGNFWGALAHNWDRSPQALYRGWSFKITPKGEFVPWSLGFRTPDGVCIDPQGEIFITDNQGEWLGASVLHHVSKGAFHGCPWFIDKYGKYKDVKPVADELEKIRKPAAIEFPYDRLSRSPTQPLCDTTGGKFGPFGGQIFVGDHTNPVIVRVALEKVNNEFQGACFPFYTGVFRGNHRLAFAPDGSLYIGQTIRGWLGKGNEGLQRLVWTGKTLFEIKTMTLTPDGFELNFTLPVDSKIASNPENYSIEHFHYLYHEQYGSPEVDLAQVTVKSVVVSDDHLKVRLILPELKKRRIYALQIHSVKSENNENLRNNVAYYTLNQLLDK